MREIRKIYPKLWKLHNLCIFSRKCGNLPNLMANFQGYKQLVNILYVKIKVYMPAIILPSLSVIRCTVND